MKSRKIISVLVIGLLVSIIIGCGNQSQNTQYINESKTSVEDDVEIKDDYEKDVVLKSKNYLKISDKNKESVDLGLFIGKVIADKENLSKIEKIEKTEDGQTVICYLDTTNSIDLKVGDVVSIGIIDNGKGKDKTEFIYNAEPINEEEYTKTVAEIVGDTRDKSTHDENVYLKDEDGNMIFVPELSIKKLVDGMYPMPTRLLNSKYLTNIKGTFDGQVIIKDIRRGDMLIKANVDNKNQYFYIDMDELKEQGMGNDKYSIGDEIKVTIGDSCDFGELAIMIE